MTASAHVLLGYASRFGSTREIAERIGGILREQGLAVDLRPVDDIVHIDMYDAVIFGSGVYDGSWAPAATDFIRRQTATLARKPVWLFTVGCFGDRHPVVGGLIRKEPKEIGEFDKAIHPRGYRVFAGVINLDHWPPWGRVLFKAFGGRDGDNRNWADIDAWAEQVAGEIRSLVP